MPQSNAAKLGARAWVCRKKVSGQTMSQEGTTAMDTFSTIVQTAKKLGVNIYDYMIE